MYLRTMGQLSYLSSIQFNVPRINVMCNNSNLHARILPARVDNMSSLHLHWLRIIFSEE